MEKSDKIFVAGHRGLVGSALIRTLSTLGYTNIITRTHAECDLTIQTAVKALFQETQPDYVFLAAAKVGGIWANDNYPADFIQQNLQIQTNVIEQAKAHQVKRLLFLGSSCIYPRECPQPIKEEYLLSGPLESTNRPYAIAKIAGIEMCRAFNRQFGTQYLAVMPTNLYGSGDNYDLKMSHVIPALIRKMHEAKINQAPQVTVWGTGLPKREFLLSDDAADACIFLMKLPDEVFQQALPLINVGCGEDLTIHELAQIIAKVVEFRGEIIFDSTKPDGTPRKLLDVDQLTTLGWRPKKTLAEGLAIAYKDFVSNGLRG
ncbi:MAG: GDP-L-fucose synthase family protein [Candidatus Berkiellales bacterium]